MNRAYWFVLIASPLFVLLGFVIANGSDMPYWDQWELVPLLDKLYNGTLTVQDLWMQHNEHRILFPKIVMLALAFVTHWNIFYELAVNVGLSICIFGVLVYRMNELGKHRTVTWSTFLGVSLLVFSVSQSENWLWGWQIQIFMNVVTVIIGVFLLTSPYFNWRKMFLASVAGIIATYSFANGLLYWMVGFGLIPIHQQIGCREKYRFVLAWIIISCSVVFSYLYKYYKPGHHPSLWSFTYHPMQSLEYFFAYLGAPLATFSLTVAATIGFLGFVGFLWLVSSAFHLYKQKDSEFSSVLPWLAIAGYSILSAGITMLGRAGFGATQAIAPRYITISNLLWITLLVLIPWMSTIKNSVYCRWVLNRKMKMVIILLLCLFEVRLVMTGWHWGINHYHTLEKARTQLNQNIYDDNYIRSNIYATDLRKSISFLKKYHLASFTD